MNKKLIHFYMPLELFYSNQIIIFKLKLMKLSNFLKLFTLDQSTLIDLLFLIYIYSKVLKVSEILKRNCVKFKI